MYMATYVFKTASNVELYCDLKTAVLMYGHQA